MSKIPLRVYNKEIEVIIDRNHLDEAIAHCKHILKSFPKHLETYRLLGKAYLEYKRYTEAVDIFSRVLVAAPSDFVAHVGMSIIRDEENKLDDAIWHMERAFETQPSNAAIQSELQRLYGRRDGDQLPRIRMTHGAMAHMYVKGELYPQAISEIKSVLKEDPGRNDMQVLLARAYYKSGAKNDAAEAASALLSREPYCLDANRILVEILEVEHPEATQIYRQRVIELDPYFAYMTGTIVHITEVSDAAVSLERLDWKGEPVSMQPDWQKSLALKAEQPTDSEPDWLKVSDKLTKTKSETSDFDWSSSSEGLNSIEPGGPENINSPGDPDVVQAPMASKSIKQEETNRVSNTIGRPLSVFLCHSSSDKPRVRKLYRQLGKEKWIDPWFDEEKLDPGDNWNFEIGRAVRKSDIFIVCLSNNAINKEGYIQREIRFALDVAEEKPEDTIFLIPLKLEECPVPDRLSDRQWVNYYEDGAYQRLIRSLRKRASSLGINTE